MNVHVLKAPGSKYIDVPIVHPQSVRYELPHLNVLSYALIQRNSCAYAILCSDIAIICVYIV